MSDLSMSGGWDGGYYEKRELCLVEGTAAIVVGLTEMPFGAFVWELFDSDSCWWRDDSDITDKDELIKAFDAGELSFVVSGKSDFTICAQKLAGVMAESECEDSFVKGAILHEELVDSRKEWLNNASVDEISDWLKSVYEG